jgi:AraC family transcriptional regulator of adaptative response/methylated-DNA-[protein]-cysteine methyltransferase
MIAERDIDRGTIDEMWQAVLDRDQDAPFLYAVRSTGVYCRPSCVSKRPSRDQVLFFENPATAEEAGFRACLRCHPRSAADPSVELVERACRLIEENLDGDVTLAGLGKRLGASPSHLQRTFKGVMGVTPRQYADTCRMNRFKHSLKEGDSVTGALYDAGYGSTSRLYERVPSHLGMAPATYRRGGLGATVRYATAESALGRLLVAATDRGICYVGLAETDEELLNALRREFFAATIEPDDGSLGGWTSLIVDFLRGQQPHLDLPLDVRATAFQRRVWEELQAIPYGETRTYGEIAASLGQPRAARAVGRACATNPAALVIPCHRAVGSGGNLVGYGWGLDRKRKLLEQEKGESKQVG